MHSHIQEVLKRAGYKTSLYRFVVVSRADAKNIEACLLYDPEREAVYDYVAHDASQVYYASARSDQDDPSVWVVDAFPQNASFFLYWFPGAPIIRGFVCKDVALPALELAVRNAKALGPIQCS